MAGKTKPKPKPYGQPPKPTVGPYGQLAQNQNGPGTKPGLGNYPGGKPPLNPSMSPDGVRPTVRPGNSPGGLPNQGVPGTQPQQGFGKKWGKLMDNRQGMGDNIPFGQLRGEARQEYRNGGDWQDIKAGLISPVAQQMFASNAAGGQGQESPYLDYYGGGGGSLGQLGQQFAGQQYGQGTQAQLFEQNPGLKDSYLGSLGKEIGPNGQVRPVGQYTPGGGPVRSGAAGAAGPGGPSQMPPGGGVPHQGFPGFGTGGGQGPGGIGTQPPLGNYGGAYGSNEQNAGPGVGGLNNYLQQFQRGRFGRGQYGVGV